MNNDLLALALDALKELHATVVGECPSLLNEDSGGSARLDMKVMGAIAALEAAQPVPADVMAALDRMCMPLDPSRLDGVTAQEDARCMKVIRDYVLAAAPSLPVDEKVHCPNCPDQGWYAIETGGCGPDGENDTRQMEQVQCEFCYTTPNSVFNANQASPAAKVELPVAAYHCIGYVDGFDTEIKDSTEHMNAPKAVYMQAAIAAQAKK